MNKSKVIALALFTVLTVGWFVALFSFQYEPTIYVEQAAPTNVAMVTEVRDCTNTIAQWDRTIPGKCAVRLDNGSVTTLLAPTIVGTKVVTCPEHSNEVNGNCYWWYAWRPVAKQGGWKYHPLF